MCIEHVTKTLTFLYPSYLFNFTYSSIIHLKKKSHITDFYQTYNSVTFRIISMGKKLDFLSTHLYQLLACLVTVSNSCKLNLSHIQITGEEYYCLNGKTELSFLKVKIFFSMFQMTQVEHLYRQVDENVNKLHQILQEHI